MAADAALFVRNLTVRATLKIWKQILHRYGWHDFSLRALIHAKHIFLPSLKCTAFLTCYHKGIETFLDLFVDDSFISFQQLSSNCGILYTNFFQYLQVHDFTWKHCTQFLVLPPHSGIDILQILSKSFKGLMSVLYNNIYSLHNPFLINIKHKWEQELEITLTEEQWAKMLKRAHS